MASVLVVCAEIDDIRTALDGARRLNLFMSVSKGLQIICAGSVSSYRRFCYPSLIRCSLNTYDGFRIAGGY